MTAQATEKPKLDLVMRPMRQGDLEGFRACFTRNNPRPRSAGSLEHQYLKNTTDKLFVDLALTPNEDRVAAIYASLPGYMRIGGRRHLMLQSLDTLTDADYRGKGLFVTLAKKTFARATDDGAALIYGFPNGNSAHGFFKKLAWSPLDPVPFLIRPLRLSYVADRLKLDKRIGPLAKLVPNVPLVLGGRTRRPTVREIVTADDRVTRLWQRFSAGIGVAIDRDAAYFRWRIFDKPEQHYRALVVEDGPELRALCIYTVEQKHGGRIGYLMELLHDATLGGLHAASHLLGVAVRAMADEGADSVLAWSMRHSPSYPVYALHGFFPLPEKLRPIELHFGVRAFDPSIDALVKDRRQWYLSYLDADTV